MLYSFVLLDDTLYQCVVPDGVLALLCRRMYQFVVRDGVLDASRRCGQLNAIGADRLADLQRLFSLIL